MMNIPPGGPATINGIIFQILWCLTETSRLHFEDSDLVPDSENFAHATLVLEPLGGGGDALVHEGIERVVQLKTKSDLGTWSLRELVDDVLPDLYKRSDLETVREFEFITDGRMGKWSQVAARLQELQSLPLPPLGHPVSDALDDVEEITFQGSLIPGGPHSPLTLRALFITIADHLRLRLSIGDSESVDETHRRLWNLLANLKFEWARTPEVLHMRLRQRLMPVVNIVENLETGINSMLMDLAIRATAGDAVIEPTVFFSGHGFNAISLTNMARLVSRGGNQIRSISRRLGYRAEEDVRNAPSMSEHEDWHSGKCPCLILPGDSGQGKTWRIASLAQSVSRFAPAVLFSTTGSGIGDRDEAGLRFATDIWGQDTAIPLERVASRWHDVNTGNTGPWLYIFIDNIQNFDEAERLFLSMPFDRGIRLAFTAPDSVSNLLLTRSAGLAMTFEVPDFTEEQAREYVTKGDIGNWYDIPADVRELLRRPLLAGLYRTVATEGWRPRNEYELLSKHFRDRYVLPFELDSPVTAQCFSQAILGVWNGKNYPWTIVELVGAGIQQEDLILLERLGWLTRDQGKCRLWHDRLLPWQIASVLSHEVQSGRLDAAEVGERCYSALFGDRSQQSAPLGYVAMDLIWHLANAGEQASEVLDTILSALGRDYVSEDELYRILIPTLGPAIVPALLQRIERTTSTNSRQVRMRIAALIGSWHSIEGPTGAIALLEHSVSDVRVAAMKILERDPTVSAIQPLYDRYLQLLEKGQVESDEDGNERRDRLWERLAVWPALRSCIVLDEVWLESRIKHAKHSAIGLGILVAFLRELPNGERIWRENKESLKDTLSSNELSQFAHCVSFWRDRDELPWLTSQLSSEESGLASFRALIRIDVRRALEVLAELTPQALYMARSWTFAPLQALLPQETANRMISLMRERPFERWIYAQVFVDLPNAIPDEVLDLLLDDLEAELPSNNIEALWRKFQTISKISRLGLLRRFWNRSNSKFEKELAKCVERHGPRSNVSKDWIGDEALEVLYKAGGEGFTRVVNQRLSSEEKYGRWDGIFASFKRLDEQTIKLLEAIACDPASSTKSTDAGWAGKALATAMMWGETIRHIVVDDMSVDRETLYSRWTQCPLSDDLMRPALEAIAQDPSHPGAIYALGFGGRSEFIPHVSNLLRTTNENATLECACLWYLHLVRPLTPEAVQAVAERVDGSHCQWLVVPTLENDSSDIACQALLNYFRSEANKQNQGPYGINEPVDLADLAVFLLLEPTTQDEAAVACRDRINRWAQIDHYSGDFIRRLCDHANEPAIRSLLDTPRIMDFLEMEAFQPDGNLRFSGKKARSIRALGVFKSSWAYAAALRVLRNPEANDRQEIAMVLLELDRELAIPTLISHAITEPSLLLRTSIARALRKEGIVQQLIVALNDADPQARSSACFLLSFADPTPEVLRETRKLLDDIDEGVYEITIDAVHRLTEASVTNELGSAYMAEQSLGRRWILLDAALETTEPGDSWAGPPEWYAQALSDQPSLVRDYAWKRLKARREDVERHIASDERRNR
jgi:HEAT repeat protein